MGYLSATLILIKKNSRLSLRDGNPLFITLSSAFLSMLILYFAQISINNGDGLDPSAFEMRNPIPDTLSSIPRCIPLSFPTCWTIAYVPSGNPQIEDWVNQVARNSNIPENEIRGFENEDRFNEFLVANPNQTQAAYVFDADSLSKIAENNVQFIIQYNDTLQADFPLGETDFHTQVVVPNMIHAMNLVIMPDLSEKSLTMDFNISTFPHPALINASSGSGFDAFGLYGPLLTFGTYFLALVFFLYKIVSEKERGLRDAMKLAGQYQSQHYISWCLPYTVLILFLTFLIIVCGHIFRFKFFTENHFSVYFLTLFIFGLSLIGWTMMVAPLIGRSESVSSVAFNLFIFGYILATSGLVVYTLDDNGEPIVSESALFLRKLFAIVPATMFVKSLQDGTVAALVGGGLSFEQAATYTEVFPIRDCWVWMTVSGLVAFLIGIYLDNVIPSRHGAPLSPFYPFLPKYWSFGKTHVSLEDTPQEELHQDFTDQDATPLVETFDTYDPLAEDPDVRAEREAVASGSRDSDALVIKNISKNFGKLLAVDDVSFSVKKNTAFAIMGHNGAGKSTLFNMLVTSLSASKGDAFIFGSSVRHDQAAVRKLLGVCPQFDIYWDKLTGAEHIEIFAALKGMTGLEREKEIDTRLDDVYLTSKRDGYAGDYSGGMQRRLSVALSLTGDPKIILLDECTSGADPLVRRDLWATIERAKKGRVVFLITHSIAEAQHLAGHNRIGIMAKGKLRVLGNAMRLKNKFGAGYRLLAVLRPEANLQIVGDALNVVCPGTVSSSVKRGERNELLAEFSLPRHARESEVLNTVKVLEDQKEEYQVMDYSLNSATLGAVFKSITSLSEDVHEDEEENESKKRFCC